MSKKYVAGLLLCLIAALSWGGTYPVMAAALKTIDPFYLTLVRYVIVAVIFALLLLLVEGPTAFKAEGQTVRLWVFGAAGFLGFNFLVFPGQQLAGASGSIIASVMMAVQPLLAVLVTWIYRGTKPTIVSLLSMLVAALGVFMVVTKGHISVLFSSRNTLLAMGLLLLGELSWVVYTVGGTDFPKWSILRYTAHTSIRGVILIAVTVAVATGAGWLKIPSAGQIIDVRWPLLYLISFAGVVGIFAWNMGNRIVTPLNGILFMNLVPITSFVITIIGGYTVSWFELAGCAITIAALVGNNLYGRYAAKKMEQVSQLGSSSDFGV